MSKLIEKSKALIISSQINSRSAIKKGLMDLGFNAKHLEIASDFPQAKSMLEQTDFNIIITDEDLGKSSALDLIPLQKKSAKNPSERVFILLLNSEATPFILADFAFRGGDVILNKPYKQEVLIKTLTSLMEEKSKIKQDDAIVLQIEDAIDLDNLAEAKELVTKIKDQDGPSALYAKGIIAKAENDDLEAFNHLAAAASKKITFKTLVKAVNSGVKCRDYDGSISLVEKWLKEFPIYHNSIPDIIRIIVAKKRFDLLNDLLNVFNTHKIQDEFVRMPLAASFVIVAQNHKSLGENDKALEYATKAIQQCGKKMVILYKAIDLIATCGTKEMAQEQFLKVGIEPITPDEKVLDLKIKGILYSKPKIAVECLKLSTQIVNRDLFTLAIECLQEIGKDTSDTISLAKKHFPDFEV